MAKKRDDRIKEKKLRDDRGCILDGDYLSPFRSFRDFTFENIKAAVGHSRYLQILVFLICTGFFLRFYNLGFNSLWLDEAATLNFAKLSFIDIWNLTAGGEYNPPLFHWVEHFMLFFGTSEIILRFIPALVGFLTIPVFYLIGKEILDRNTGIIAATLLTFSPFHLFYSQDARAYSMVLFFMSLALLFYLIAFRTNAKKFWALFGIFSALAFWTHFYSAIIIGTIILFTLLINAKKLQGNISDLKPILISLAAFVFLCLPLLIVTIPLFFVRTSSSPTYGIQGISIVTESMQQFFGYNVYSAIFFSILLILGLFQIFKSDKAKFILFFVIILTTFIVSWGLSYKMPMIPRYLIFMLPIMYCAVAASYLPICRLFNNHSAVYAFIAVIILIATPFMITYYSSFSKEDWRGFSKSIESMTKEGDIVVLAPGYISQPFDYYYSNATDKTLEFESYTKSDLENVSSVKGNSSIFIIITSDIVAADPGGGSLEYLNENATYVGQNSGINLFVIN
jgi:4-amino-4-deoxy-L-arabinose transferase-like glycosyltransferase